jgi:hypothetical protein
MFSLAEIHYTNAELRVFTAAINWKFNYTKFQVYYDDVVDDDFSIKAKRGA